MQKAVRVVGLQISGNTFWTKTPFVYRKLISGFQADDMVVLDEKFHSALHPAVWAVRRDDLVDLTVGLPTAVRLIVKMRPKAFDNVFEVLDLGHTFVSLLVPFGAGPMKDRFDPFRHSRISKTAHDALAARAIILKRAAICHSIVKPQFLDDIFEIIDPHLPDEHGSATRTNRLLH